MSTYEKQRQMVRTLKRRKVGDRQYEIVRRDTDAVVALATQTGERGRDHYPWDVVPTDTAWLPAQESLTACIDAVAGLLLTQPTTPVHVCDACRDKPGSDTARLKGCTCAVIDNGHGHNEYRMIVFVDCPVHG